MPPISARTWSCASRRSGDRSTINGAAATSRKNSTQYVWADGIHVNVRLENEANQRQCLLVLMGATVAGQKELIAVVDGYRESEQSWYELLIDLKSRGLSLAPKLAIGDRVLGFWAALRTPVR